MIFQNSRLVENITDAKNLQLTNLRFWIISSCFFDSLVLTQAQTVILRCQKEAKNAKKNITQISLFFSKIAKKQKQKYLWFVS